MVCCYKAINKAILDRKKNPRTAKIYLLTYLLTLILILINFLCGFFFGGFYNFTIFIILIFFGNLMGEN